MSSLKDYVIFTTDKNGIITSWNEGAVNVFGFKVPEILGKDGSILFTAVDIQNGVPEQELRTAIEQGKAKNERYHVRQDGTLFWGSGLVYPLFDENNNHRGYTKILRNKTESKKVQDRMIEAHEIAEKKQLILRKEFEVNERRLKLAIEASHIGIWDLDYQTGEATRSFSHALIYGYPDLKQQWSVDLFLQHIIPEDREFAKQSLQKAWEDNRLDIQVRIRRVDNSVRWVHVNGEVSYDEITSARRMIGTTLDITEIKELEQRKDELISIVSHELKTPVTSLKASVQLLMRKFIRSGDEFTTVMLGKMNVQINRLTILIRDLLDVSRIEGGHLQLRHTEYSFKELVDEVVCEVQRTSSSHQVIAEELPQIYIQGDRERTGQVIINLLTNAIKYSPGKNKVIISVRTGNGEMVCSVKDFGIGIPPDKQKRIFERFYRVSEDRNYSFAGIGMGLYISSELIKRLGGKIWFESVPDEGTTFSFSLPLDTGNNKDK